MRSSFQSCFLVTLIFTLFATSACPDSAHLSAFLPLRRQHTKAIHLSRLPISGGGSKYFFTRKLQRGIQRTLDVVPAAEQVVRNFLGGDTWPDKKYDDPVQREALQEFYAALNGDYWTQTSADDSSSYQANGISWTNDSASYCSWEGVLCCLPPVGAPKRAVSGVFWMFETSRSNTAVARYHAYSCSRRHAVMGLVLPSSNLSGVLPPSIIRLSNLYILELSGNPGLTGSLPANLQKIPLLSVLDVYDTNITCFGGFSATSMNTSLIAADSSACPLPMPLQFSNDTLDEQFDNYTVQCPRPILPDAGNARRRKAFLAAGMPEESSLIWVVEIPPSYWGYDGCTCSMDTINLMKTIVKVAPSSQLPICVPDTSIHNLPSEGPVVIRSTARPWQWPVLTTMIVLMGLGFSILILIWVRNYRSKHFLKYQKGPPGLDGEEITLCATDVQGSTELWEWDADIMDCAIAMHDDLLRAAMDAYDGYEVTTEGDAFFVAFHNAADAVKWATAVQLGLMQVAWPAELLQHPACHPQSVSTLLASSGKGNLPGLKSCLSEDAVLQGLLVRIGIATGLPQQVGRHKVTNRYKYLGNVTSLTAAVTDLGNGGQVLMEPHSFQRIHMHLSSIQVTDAEIQPFVEKANKRSAALGSATVQPLQIRKVARHSQKSGKLVRPKASDDVHNTSNDAVVHSKWGRTMSHQTRKRSQSESILASTSARPSLISAWMRMVLKHLGVGPNTHSSNTRMNDLELGRKSAVKTDVNRDSLSLSQKGAPTRLNVDSSFNIGVHQPGINGSVMFCLDGTGERVQQSDQSYPERAIHEPHHSASSIVHRRNSPQVSNNHSSHLRRSNSDSKLEVLFSRTPTMAATCTEGAAMSTCCRAYSVIMPRVRADRNMMHAKMTFETSIGQSGKHSNADGKPAAVLKDACVKTLLSQLEASPKNSSSAFNFQMVDVLPAEQSNRARFWQSCSMDDLPVGLEFRSPKQSPAALAMQSAGEFPTDEIHNISTFDHTRSGDRLGQILDGPCAKAANMAEFVEQHEHKHGFCQFQSNATESFKSQPCSETRSATAACRTSQLENSTHVRSLKSSQMKHSAFLVSPYAKQRDQPVHTSSSMQGAQGHDLSIHTQYQKAVPAACTLQLDDGCGQKMEHLCTTQPGNLKRKLNELPSTVKEHMTADCQIAGEGLRRSASMPNHAYSWPGPSRRGVRRQLSSPNRISSIPSTANHKILEDLRFSRTASTSLQRMLEKLECSAESLDDSTWDAVSSPGSKKGDGNRDAQSQQAIGMSVVSSNRTQHEEEFLSPPSLCLGHNPEDYTTTCLRKLDVCLLQHSGASMNQSAHQALLLVEGTTATKQPYSGTGDHTQIDMRCASSVALSAPRTLSVTRPILGLLAHLTPSAHSSQKESPGSVLVGSHSVTYNHSILTTFTTDTTNDSYSISNYESALPGDAPQLPVCSTESKPPVTLHYQKQQPETLSGDKATALPGDPSVKASNKDLEGRITVIDMGVHSLKDAWVDLRTTNNEGQSRVQIIQILPFSLQARAVFFPKLSSVQQWTPSYFDAPGASEGLLPGQKLPEVILVFICAEGYKKVAMYSTELAELSLAHFCEAIRVAIKVTGAYECQEYDGSFMVACHNPSMAVELGLLIQLTLLGAPWPAELLELVEGSEVFDDAGNLLYRGLRAKVGLYAGKPTSIVPHTTTGRADYFGTLVNRAARLMAGAHGGQVLMDKSSAEKLIREHMGAAQQMDPDACNGRGMSHSLENIEIVDMGLFSFKGVADSISVSQVRLSSLNRRQFPTTAANHKAKLVHSGTGAIQQIAMPMTKVSALEEAAIVTC